MPRCAALLPNHRPCGQPAAGNPPLCAEHEDLLAADSTFTDDVWRSALDHVLDRPEARDVLGRASGILDRAGRMIDELARNARAPRPAPRGTPPPNGHRRAPPPPHPPHPPRPPTTPREDPRVVLGFAPTVKLTRTLVKERQRELAKLWHPDRGGSEEAMKRLNAAVEALLRTVRA